MEQFRITIDSSCDGDVEELSKKDVDVIFYHYFNKEEDFLDDMNDEKMKIFYENMRKGTKYKTSQLNEPDYYHFFKTQIKKNPNILHISLTEGLSGSINQARIAASKIMLDYPKTNIKVVDSLIASNGLLTVLDVAIGARKEKMDLEQAYCYVQDMAHNVNTFYTVDDLTYFVRGGRLSKLAGFVGNLLHINPVLTCAPNGNLKIESKLRGRKNTIKYIVNRIKETVINPENQVLYACSADSEAQLDELIAAIIEEVPFKEVKKYQMGPIIGSHAGPGLQAFFYLGTKRV